MVRHRMRSRRGGTRGGSAHPQAVQSSIPSSPPPPHENSPPPNSPHRHYPQTRSGRGHVQASMANHRDFQLHTTTFPFYPSSVPHSTQFRFQSSLNRPIITANVTIVFSEESEQHSTQARNSEAQLQEERSHGVGHGFEQLSKEESRGIQSGRLYAKGEHASNIWQPGGSSVGASISMAIPGSSSGTLPAREPPGGVAEGGMAEKDEDWDRYTCPIVEETLYQDEPK